MDVDTVPLRDSQARDRLRFRTRFAETSAEIAACQALRGRLFLGSASSTDRDHFDDVCDHLLVERSRDDTLVGTCRVMRIETGAEIQQSYSAQYYDLARLAEYPGRMGEIGRFCMLSELEHADILRIAWGALAAWVDANKIDMLFGCSSFAGTDPMVYSDCFHLLAKGHLAPRQYAPLSKADAVWPYAEFASAGFDRSFAMKRMPPLLRSYLTMGGWVSDHAVIDRDLKTLHVFTGLEVALIPQARARALRSVATLLGEQALT